MWCCFIRRGPNLCVFVYFHFEMCSAPQGRALFRQLNFQKRPDTGLFCAFWLRNVFHAKTACSTCATSQLPKRIIWTPASGILIKISNCFSGHNGVHYPDISTSINGPRPPVFLRCASKCAPHHKSVLSLIAPVASGLPTQRFSEPTFPPQR